MTRLLIAYDGEGVALARDAGLRATGVAAIAAGGRAIPRLIAELADEHDVTLIVVGSDGGSRLHAALIGSGTAGVVSHSTRPVLVVPR